MTFRGQLSAGSIRAISQQQQCGTPTVQIIDVKKIESPKAQQQQMDRFRLVISDGINYQQAMLATQLNQLVKDGQIVTGCVVSLKEFVCNTVHNRKIVIILDLGVVSGAVDTIGSPTNVDQSAGGPAQGAPPVTAAPNAPNAPPPFRAAPQQHQPMSGASAAPSAPGSQMDAHIFPIRSLNPYQNRWTIKARVTNKSDIRHWNNARGSGKLFSVDLLDAQGGEIRCTMFNDAVEKFEPIFQKDGVYYISRGTLKIANPKSKQYSSIKNDYELNLEQNSIVQPCEESPDIPRMTFAFVPIEEVEKYAKDDVIDVIGIIYHIGEVGSITTRQGKPLSKRAITLVDMTRYSIELTVWGEQAENIPWPVNSILAVKGAKVSTFNNRTLSTVSSSHIENDPNIAEAHELREWFKSQGMRIGNIFEMTKSVGGMSDGPKSTPRKTVNEVKESTVGHRDRPLWFEVKATISLVKHDGVTIWYLACPQCNKKVNPSPSGKYSCEKCQLEYDNYQPRYILNFMCVDHTGAIWMNSFDDVGTIILGHPASEMEQLKEAQNPSYEAAFQEAFHKQYIFKIRAKEEQYNEEFRGRYTAVSATPLDFAEQSRYLIQQIQGMI